MLIACSTAPKAKDDKLCTPGAYVFCRCRDRQEGSKLCKEDAQSFGPCEPCESADNPEMPLDPEGPQRRVDPTDGEPEDAGSDSGGRCGDHIVQAGEDCDDDNADDTDGCDQHCKLSGVAPASSNACPGLEVHVWGGSHRPTLVSKTNGSGNRSVTPNCTSTSHPTTGAAAADRVFRVVAHKTGTMTVALTETGYNAFLYASDACAADKNTWLACVNEQGGIGGETMTFPVEAGKAYHVFVDGAGVDSSKEGSFRVTFSIP